METNESKEGFEVAICDLKTASIESKILTIRGRQVILDKDLSVLYDVETKYLNRVVKRNIGRFPENFMFQLTKEESDSLRCQFVTSNEKGGTRYLPYVFTEQGVAMLSAILRSPTAITVSIRIMEAFVAMRRFMISNEAMFQRVQSLEIRQWRTDEKVDSILNRLDSYDMPLEGIFYDGQIFDAHSFVSDLIREAHSRIILIDNYIDDTVLKRLDKRRAGVAATIYTQRISNTLQNDINLHNEQYPSIDVHITSNVHDRFLIIDDIVLSYRCIHQRFGKKDFCIQPNE